jgi:hypothetical protein
VLWGFVYLLPPLVSISAIGTPYLGPAIAFQLFMAAVSIVHAFYIRPQYRSLMLGAPPASAPRAPFLWTPSQRRALPEGLDEGLAQGIREAEAELNAVARLAAGIGKPEVRAAVRRLCDTGERILDELRREPRKVSIARGFLTYYLEATRRLVAGYAELSRQGLESPNTRDTLTQVEAMLGEVQRAFDRQLQDLLAQQLLDLDTEIVLLERMLQSDERLALPGAPVPPAVGRVN